MEEGVNRQRAGRETISVVLIVEPAKSNVMDAKRKHHQFLLMQGKVDQVTYAS